MMIKYDESADALYIRLKERKYSESDEIKNGFIIDYDDNGIIIGLEILDASHYLNPQELSSVNYDFRNAG